MDVTREDNERPNKTRTNETKTNKPRGVTKQEKTRRRQDKHTVMSKPHNTLTRSIQG